MSPALYPAELLTPEQMGRADAASSRYGVPSQILMANAGRAVARAVQRRYQPCRTLVLCGPGNNGGDGYVVARLLSQQGWPVSVAALAAPRAGSDAAGRDAIGMGRPRDFAPGSAGRADLVIDAVFGAGLTRDVDGVAADTLRAARRIVAVDVPSGLDGATGQVRGYAPQAEMTVTFFRLKPGHLLLPGRELCGALRPCGYRPAASDLERSVRPDTFADRPGAVAPAHARTIRPQIRPRPRHRAGRAGDDRGGAHGGGCGTQGRRRHGDDRRLRQCRRLPYRLARG